MISVNEKQYIVTRIPEIDEDIQHYGVLGMKWGVRHDPARAYAKATAKQETLNRKVSTTRDKHLKTKSKANKGVSIKYQKKQAKADRLQSKADKKKYGLFTNATKAAKLQVKADRAQYKANKYKSRYEKRNAKASKATGKYARARRKAERWTREMEKTFNGYDVNKLSEQHISAGEKFIKKIA